MKAFGRRVPYMTLSGQDSCATSITYVAHKHTKQHYQSIFVRRMASSNFA